MTTIWLSTQALSLPITEWCILKYRHKYIEKKYDPKFFNGTREMQFFMSHPVNSRLVTKDFALHTFKGRHK